MEIQFKVRDKNYILTSDTRQYILGVDYGLNKDGKQNVQEHVYFPKLSTMIEHIYEIGVRNNEVDSFRALAKHSEEVKVEVLRIGELFTMELETE